MEIRLEDDFNPTWEDARTRLKVASEIHGFPLAIVQDEVAYAYKDFVHMWHHKINTGEATHDDFQPLITWWTKHATYVQNMDEATRVLYPWFHDGEEIDSDPMGDMMGRNL